MKERNEELKKKYIEGKTLEELGDEYSITKVRVWQILRRMGVTRGDRIVPKKVATLTAHVTDGIRRAVENEAAKLGKSVSEFVNELIIEGLESRSISFSEAPIDHPRLPLC